MNGGPGLSVDDVDGTEDQEERGKQDSGKKATTSAASEALSQTNPSTNKPGLDTAAVPAKMGRQLEMAGHPKHQPPSKVSAKGKTCSCRSNKKAALNGLPLCISAL